MTLVWQFVSCAAIGRIFLTISILYILALLFGISGCLLSGSTLKLLLECAMVVTNDMHLPTEEELTVPEIHLSGPALRAGSFHLGKYCEYQNNVRGPPTKAVSWRNSAVLCKVEHYII